MNQIAINNMSVKYCWAVKKMLDGKTRYKIVVSYVKYGKRCCLVIKTHEHCRSQQRFETAVFQAFVRAVGKLYKVGSQNISGFDELVRKSKSFDTTEETDDE